MKNILSYCLFGTEERFWSSIPFNLIANNLIYDGFINRYHISPEVTKSRLYPLLQEVSSQSTKLEIDVVNEEYTGTEPTIWRMKPLWDPEVEFLFCRDLDSAPRSDERRATLLFQKSNFSIHGIRSYWTHSTKLMAGLCGFNVPRVRRSIVSYKSFDQYRNFGKKYLKNFCTNWQWGCDQHLLRVFFFAGRHGIILTKQTLDTPLNSAKRVPAFKPIQIQQEKYDAISLDHINPEILEICDSLVANVGLPIEVPAAALRKALKLDCEMSIILRNIFLKYPDIAEYYHLKGEL